MRDSTIISRQRIRVYIEVSDFDVHAGAHVERSNTRVFVQEHFYSYVSTSNLAVVQIKRILYALLRSWKHRTVFERRDGGLESEQQRKSVTD